MNSKILNIAKVWGNKVIRKFGFWTIWDEIVFKDKWGNVSIYYEDFEGEWKRKSYDKDGRITSFQVSNGFKYEKTYKNNNVVKYHETLPNNGGLFIYEREYDEFDNITLHKDSNGWWFKKRYDDRQNVIYYENSDGLWTKKKYDYDQNIICYEDQDGNFWDKELMPNIPFPYSL